MLLGFDVANIFLTRVDKQAIKLILRKYGATIGKDCDIESGQVFHNCKDYSNLWIGNNCHIGKSCFFDLRDKVVIRDNVVISMQTTFITHTDMSKSELSNRYPASHGPIVIGRSTYIGVNSTILQGIDLAENSFVAAGSMVTRNTEPHSMVGGVPAREIKDLKTTRAN